MGDVDSWDVVLDFLRAAADSVHVVGSRWFLM